MKSKLLVLAIALGFAGCAGRGPTISKQPVEGGGEQSSGRSAETVAAHSVEEAKDATVTRSPSDRKKPGGKSGWTRSGDPIDTSKFDSEIASAEKARRSSPNDRAAGQRLSRAYFSRGEALTRARQYAAAIGDYRRALKYDPDNREAVEWIDRIIMIYNGLNKEYPKEGEEPEPLEFKKATV